MGASVPPQAPPLMEQLRRLLGGQRRLPELPPAVVHAPGERTPGFDRLFTSGYADTLFQALGPQDITVAPLRPGILGVTRGAQGKIRIELDKGNMNRPPLVAGLFGTRKELDRFHPEQTLPHELAHGFASDKLKGVNILDPGFHLVREFGRGGLWGQANTRPTTNLFSERDSPNEHLAEAVTQATDLLRNTTSGFDPKSKPAMAVVKNALVARETQIPGTLAVMSYLLSRPIYSKHPLKKHILAAYKDRLQQVLAARDSATSTTRR